jgi:hypothetical protein
MQKLRGDGMMQEEYQKLSQFIKEKLAKQKNSIYEKVKKKLSLEEIVKFNEFDPFYLKNKQFIDNIIKYICQCYKGMCPKYYLSAELTRALIVVLSKQNIKSKIKIKPDNPFGFKYMFDAKYNKHIKNKIKKKDNNKTEIVKKL